MINTELEISKVTLDGIAIPIVVGKETKIIEITLPSVFANNYDIYYMSVTSDKLLISGNAENCGLWLYTISTNTWVQIYSGYGYWANFQQVTDDKWLIGKGAISGGGEGVLIYNSKDDSCVLGYDKGINIMFTQLNDTKWMLYSSSVNSYIAGCVIYNSANDTFIKLYDTGTSWNVQLKLSDTKFMLSSSAVVLYDVSDDSYSVIRESGWVNRQQVSETMWLGTSSNTIVSYNSETNEFTDLYAGNTYELVYFQANDTKWLIRTKYNVSNQQGIFLYNSQDNTLNYIWQTGYMANIYKVSATKVLVSSQTNTFLGLLVIDLETDTCSQVYETSYDWRYFNNVTNDIVLIGSYQSNTGLLRYNAVNNSCIPVYSTGYRWSGFYNVKNNKCLISGDGGNGILLYNAETDACEPKYTSGYYWTIFYEFDENTILISATNDSSSNRGILRYNALDDTIVRKTQIGSYWKFFCRVSETKVLIGSYYDSNYGLMRYDSETDTVTQKYHLGSYWNHFKQVTENAWLITGSPQYTSASNKPEYVMRYLVDTDSMSNLTPRGVGTYLDMFELDENGCYISSGDKSKNPRTLYYSQDTDKVTLNKYYLGEY